MVAPRRWFGRARRASDDHGDCGEGARIYKHACLLFTTTTTAAAARENSRGPNEPLLLLKIFIRLRYGEDEKRDHSESCRK